ncbi:MAG: hypothetical protein O3A84_07065 [Proteobacteria bacterium]|nr:hypothetical protein [Pseudomonadota bacterium]
MKNESEASYPSQCPPIPPTPYQKKLCALDSKKDIPGSLVVGLIIGLVGSGEGASFVLPHRQARPAAMGRKRLI